MILDNFNLSNTAQVYRNYQSIVDDHTVDNVQYVFSFKCLMWSGSASERYVSEKFRKELSATLAAAPGTDVRTGDTIHIKDREYYVLGAVDSGRAEQVLEIYLKEAV